MTFIVITKNDLEDAKRFFGDDVTKLAYGYIDCSGNVGSVARGSAEINLETELTFVVVNLKTAIREFYKRKGPAVAALQKLAKQVTDVRIWVHFGEVNAITLTASNVIDKWKEPEYAILSGLFPGSRPVPFSKSDAGNHSPAVAEFAVCFSSWLNAGTTIARAEYDEQMKSLALAWEIGNRHLSSGQNGVPRDLEVLALLRPMTIYCDGLLFAKSRGRAEKQKLVCAIEAEIVRLRDCAATDPDNGAKILERIDSFPSSTPGQGDTPVVVEEVIEFASNFLRKFQEDAIAVRRSRLGSPSPEPE